MKPFLTICPRSKKYLDYNVEAVPLRVVLGDVDASPDVDIKVNKMATGFRQFVNNSAYSDTFKIDVVIHRDDFIKGHTFESVSVPKASTIENAIVVGDVNLDNLNLAFEEGYESGTFEYFDSWDALMNGFSEVSLLKALDYWIKHAEPLYVTTRAIGISKGEYIITENSSRKQSHRDYVIWSLEFMKYKELPSYSFTTESTAITKAIKAKNKKSTAKSKKAKEEADKITNYRKKLSKCNINNLKYSKTKKVVECVKTMQHMLVHYGCLSADGVDGWFGNDTKEAVKKFQKKYQKKYNLTVNGFVNGPTRDAMVKGGKISTTNTTKFKGKTATQVGETIVIP